MVELLGKTPPGGRSRRRGRARVDEAEDLVVALVDQQRK
jgi:hypothetical protein